MKTKLTLSIDQELIEFAHKQAQAHKQSVSGMFSDYLRHRQVQLKHAETPSIEAMTGSLQEYAIDDSKGAIRNAYAKKYPR